MVEKDQHVYGVVGYEVVEQAGSMVMKRPDGGVVIAFDYLAPPQWLRAMAEVDKEMHRLFDESLMRLSLGDTRGYALMQGEMYKQMGRWLATTRGEGAIDTPRRS